MRPQQPPPDPNRRPQQPAPVDPNRQMMIVLPAFAWNTVVASLRKQPYELVADIIGELQQQFTQQAAGPPPGEAPQPEPPPAPSPESIGPPAPPPTQSEIPTPAPKPAPARDPADVDADALFEDWAHG